MKQKNWMMLGLVVAVVLLANAYGYVKIPSVGAGTAPGTAPGSGGGGGVATVSVACYDVDQGLDNGKVGAQVEVDKGGVPVYPLTNAATGVVTLDANQGYHAGDTVVVRCLNNSATGYYENRVTTTLQSGVNAVAVPLHKVGTGQVAVTSLTAAIGSGGSNWIEYDLSMTAQRQYLYKPILAIKDSATNTNTAISSGNITSISCSGGHTVSCDTDAISGYNFCCQLDAPEFVSTNAIVSKGKINLYAGNAKDPIGNLTMKIYNSVPYPTFDGQASINRAIAYQSTGLDMGAIQIT
jgi:hypothetical protein